MQVTTVTAPVPGVAEALRTSLAGAFGSVLSALPRLLAFGLVLVVGWLLSSLTARGVSALLRAVRFDELARRSGLAGFVTQMGLSHGAGDVLALVAKWFVRLVTLVVAFDTLGLPAVSGVLQQLVLWLPNLVVGLVALVIGGLAANALSRLVRGAASQAGFTDPDLLAAATRIAVWSFAVVVAVSQLGIATTVINTLLVGVVGAVALAAGLAFGLAGRDRAARLLDRVAARSASGISWARAAADGPARAANGDHPPPAGRSPDRPVVLFEEDWTPRAPGDRRRMDREDPDRRRAGHRHGTGEPV
jgi:hypothetical protein